jgi:hypothetical protein
VLGEGVDAGLHQRDQLGAGLEVDVVGVEDLPVGGLDLALAWVGTLASRLRARWIRHRWRSERAKLVSAR